MLEEVYLLFLLEPVGIYRDSSHIAGAQVRKVIHNWLAPQKRIFVLTSDTNKTISMQL